MLKLTILSLLCTSFMAVATTTTTTTAVDTATRIPSATESAQQSLFLNNNVPKIEDGCVGHYKCERKLKSVKTPPRPCVKYCLRYVECSGAAKVKRSGRECVELNETLLEQEESQSGGPLQNRTQLPIMPVALIDFPCQPGYLPDSRGRCREVW